MATKYEWFEPSINDALQVVNPANWGGQTFAVGYTGEDIQFECTEIHVSPYVYDGDVDDVTYSIRAVGDDSKAIGADICSGVIDSSTFASSPGKDETITMTYQSGTKLEPSTSYAICWRMESNGNLRHGERYSTSVYAGGYTIRSYDSGSSWDDLYTNQDVWFQIWGEAGGGGGFNAQVNIGDTWKALEGVQVNIGDAWKAVETIQINVGDTWKDV